MTSEAGSAGLDSTVWQPAREATARAERKAFRIIRIARSFRCGGKAALNWNGMLLL
jgi:hypothetical protein